MKRLTAVVVLLASMPIVLAQDDDFHAEVMEWVIEPCMEVAAAYGVKSLDRESIELGMKREHVALVMAASRDSAARDLSSKMSPTATWEERRAAYPHMLKFCLLGLKDAP